MNAWIHVFSGANREQRAQVVDVRVDAAVRDEAEQVDALAALERRAQRRVLEEASRRRSPGSRASDPGRAGGRSRSSDGRPRSCPSGPAGRPAASPEASIVVCGYSAQSRSKTGVVGELDRVARARRGAAPAVEDDERYERDSAARQIVANDSTSSEAPPTSAPSTSGCAASSAALSGLTEPP